MFKINNKAKEFSKKDNVAYNFLGSIFLLEYIASILPDV